MVSKRESKQIIDYVNRVVKNAQFPFVTDSKIDFNKASVGTISGTTAGGQISDGAVYNRHVNPAADIRGTKIKEATTLERGTVKLAGNMETVSGEVVESTDYRLTNTFDSLFDTPSGYVGYAHKLLTVNDNEDGLEYADKFLIEDEISSYDYAGIFIIGIAGETLEFGDSVVFESGKWIKTDAKYRDKTAGYIGLVVSSHSESYPLDTDVSILIRGYVQNDDWILDSGEPAYISTVSGEFSQSTVNFSDGNFLRVIGYAKDNNTLWYNPDNTIIKVKIVTDTTQFDSFLTLSDTPTTYSGQAGKFVKVNSAGNGIEFVS